jgi:hypothetical protein
VHIARCLSCRSKLFVEFLDATAQLRSENTVDS